MRRCDFDVTNSIRTTDPAAVGAEVIRLYKRLYDTPPRARATTSSNLRAHRTGSARLPIAISPTDDSTSQ